MSVSDETSASQFSSATPRFRLFAMRRSMSPFTRSSGRSLRPAHSRSRSARMRGTSVAISSRAMRKLRPCRRSGASAASLSAVPARVRRRASAPPAHAPVAPHVQRADALGTVSLVRGQRHEIDGQLREIDRRPCPSPARRRRETARRGCGDRPDRRDVLDHAEYLFPSFSYFGAILGGIFATFLFGGAAGSCCPIHRRRGGREPDWFARRSLWRVVSASERVLLLFCWPIHRTA